MADFNQIVSEKGRKRSRNEDKWKKNVRKIKRNIGEDYVNSNDILALGKSFNPINDCCKRSNCWEKFNNEEQEEIFDYFWNIGDYNKQNYWIANLMKRENTKILVIFH